MGYKETLRRRLEGIGQGLHWRSRGVEQKREQDLTQPAIRRFLEYSSTCEFILYHALVSATQDSLDFDLGDAASFVDRGADMLMEQMVGFLKDPSDQRRWQWEGLHVRKTFWEMQLAEPDNSYAVANFGKQRLDDLSQRINHLMAPQNTSHPAQ